MSKAKFTVWPLKDVRERARCSNMLRHTFSVNKSEIYTNISGSFCFQPLTMRFRRRAASQPPSWAEIHLFDLFLVFTVTHF